MVVTWRNRVCKTLVLLLAGLSVSGGNALAVTVSFTTPGAVNWTAPVGVTSITVEAWGGGGGGGAATGNPAKGGGGAGGQYAMKVVAVTPGNIYAIVVGAGGAVGATIAGGVGGSSTFATTTVVAKGGAGGALAATNNSCAAAGIGSAAGGVGDAGFVFAGGSGSACAVITTPAGGAGGGGAGSTGAGGNAIGNVAGLGAEIGGGDGGAGLAARAAGNPGILAGGGYATTATDRSGGAGGGGKVVISYAAAPIVTTSAATGLTRGDAELNGSVDDNGASTTVTFEYGPTVAYGSTAVAVQSPLAAASGNTVVSAIVSGLTCNSTYHFRAVGVNSSGTTYGGDQVFTTAPCVQVFVTASPTSCSNVAGIGTQAWGAVTPNDPFASDNLYATANVDDNLTTNYLQCTGYGFAIPAGATINGILVNLERSASGTLVRDAAVRLVKGGVIQAVDRSTVTNYPKTDAIEAHGAFNDLWGTAWTLADINATNFGAALASTKAGTSGGVRTVKIDHMPITVSYTPTAGMDHVVINAPAAAVAPTQVSVTITPHTVSHGSIAGAGTISLSTSTGTGDWTIGTGIGTLTPGAANSGLATYTFGAGENSVSLGFASQSAGTVTLNVADAFGANLLLYTPVAEKANVIVFSGVAFALTSGPCTNGVAIGTAGTCTEVGVGGVTAGQALGNIYITSVNAARVPTYLHKTQNQTRSMQFGLSCNNPIANAGVQATFSATAEILPLCAGNGAAPTTWTAGVTLTFLANTPSVGPFSFNYADVGKVVMWTARAGTAEMGSSAAFVVKPDHFDISNVVGTVGSVANPAAADAAGAKFIKAGEAFSVTVKAMTSGGVPTPNYGKETPSAQGVRLIPTIVAPAGEHNPTLTNAATGATNDVIAGLDFGATGQVSDANGVATVTNLAWKEAGIFTLSANADNNGAANYLGATVTGVTTGTIGNIGRFYAAQFALSGGAIANRTGLGGVCAAPAGCGTFTYLGEEMSALFTLTAKATDGTTTLQNYSAANNFAKLNPMAAVTAGTGGPLGLGAVDSAATRTPFTPCGITPVHPCLTPAQATTGTFVLGAANITVPFTLYRNKAATAGPYAAVDVAVAPQDSDGIIMAAYNRDTVNVVAGTPNHTFVGQTQARYGRLKLSNAHGSELLKLPVQVQAQYWNGTTFVINTADNSSVLSAANIALGNYQRNTGDTWTTSPTLANAAANAGMWQVNLAKPGATFTGLGSVDICVDLGADPASGTVCSATIANLPYLQGLWAPGTSYDNDPGARASFGVYKGNNEFIYLRESY